MTKGIDEMIHQPVRLRIMALLAALDTDEQVDFTYVRKLLKLSDGNLGAHLAKLQEAGYVAIEKAFVNKRPKTYIQATGRGRDAFRGHVKALKQIVEGLE